MITRIEAYRYRCFKNLAVDVGSYNVLAGANGSGKTTLLDIPALLGDMLTSRYCSDAFLTMQPPWADSPRAHTLVELVHQQRGDDFVFVIEAELPPEVIRVFTEAASESDKDKPEQWPKYIRYELQLEVFNKIELHVKNEFLYLYPEKRRPAIGLLGGLQGEAEGYTKQGRPVLRDKQWRPVLYRNDGGPSQYMEELGPRTRHQENRVAPMQLALSGLSVDETLYPAANWFRKLLEEESVFYDPKWSTLRRASKPGQPRKVIPSGENLPWLAMELKKDDPERFDSWVEHVQTALPIESIDVVLREEDYHAYFVVKYGGDYTVTSSGLSDGTLRLMAMTLLPYLSKTPQLTVLEEPENGIHPKAIEVVLQSLTSVYEGQVWISTHSPIVLAHTDLENVLCTRLGDKGAVEVIPGDEHPQLKNWKGGIDIGTLFAAGVLG